MAVATASASSVFKRAGISSRRAKVQDGSKPTIGMPDFANGAKVDINLLASLRA